MFLGLAAATETVIETGAWTVIASAIETETGEIAAGYAMMIADGTETDHVRQDETETEIGTETAARGAVLGPGATARDHGPGGTIETTDATEVDLEDATAPPSSATAVIVPETGAVFATGVVTEPGAVTDAIPAPVRARDAETAAHAATAVVNRRALCSMIATSPRATEAVIGMCLLVLVPVPWPESPTGLLRTRRSTSVKREFAAKRKPRRTWLPRRRPLPRAV